jgi:hypothetical protein
MRTFVTPSRRALAIAFTLIGAVLTSNVSSASPSLNQNPASFHQGRKEFKADCIRKHRKFHEDSVSYACAEIIDGITQSTVVCLEKTQHCTEIVNTAAKWARDKRDCERKGQMFVEEGKTYSCRARKIPSARRPPLGDD